MSDLQRIMLRSTNKMDDARQQNMTVGVPVYQLLLYVRGAIYLLEAIDEIRDHCVYAAMGCVRVLQAAGGLQCRV